MAKETKTLSFSISQKIYKQLEQLAEQLEISKSEILRNALRQYIFAEERWQQIRRWGEETARDFNVRDEEDVDKIIHEYRQEKVKC